ncbi:efflux RND transporter periplasmic adaptor subunit [Seohaeicola zhoushanensis]|uniref:Membrane protein n=1 Tax=Seohaeicola zhoushanensis TaxID=1569283 RepID=A0A8J3GUP0_9RHOB|nr:efflux RND transporter periplasmic adaptor subunit [Seohaeicola zhoushanensis]GHF37365.1 membrane protein [Seohaeicola zhoushanensis]
MLRLAAIALTVLLAAPPLLAQDLGQVQRVSLTSWKSVFGRIEARDRIPARARLGGTLVEISVAEGSKVTAGQTIGVITDEKLNLQLDAVDAQIRALESQLENARTELKRGESLVDRGVTTAQRLDQLRTDVQVLEGQVDAAKAERDVLVQREAEGTVVAPIAGTVLDVPVTSGSVVMAGEVVAQIGGGGFFLRLAIPERHATALEEGAEIRVSEGADERKGTLAKVYPLIENGRVIADVEVEGLPTDFVDARVPVRLPVGTIEALVVPQSAVQSRMGLDFVTVAGPGGAPRERAVVIGRPVEVDGVKMVEILSGLTEGETLVRHE